MNRTELKKKARVAADQILRDKGYISAADVLLAMGRLSNASWPNSRQRRSESSFTNTTSAGHSDGAALRLRSERAAAHTIGHREPAWRWMCQLRTISLN